MRKESFLYAPSGQGELDCMANSVGCLALWISCVRSRGSLALAYTFLYFHLPLPFTAFSLSAIAITFWYGGTKPGILAVLLSLLARNHLLRI